MNQITQTLPFRLFVLAVASVTLVMPFMTQAAALEIDPTYVGIQTNNVVSVLGDAATGFADASFASNGVAKTDIYFDPVQLFGRAVTLGQIESLSYWTKKDSDHVTVPADWYLTLYTAPYEGDVSSANWYGDRIGAEPYFSENLDDPANTWNLWSTDGAQNTLRFFESTDGAMGANFGSYTDPSWDTLMAGNALSGQPYATRVLSSFSVQTGSAWAAGFEGQVDGLTITLTDGTVATVNFEDVPPPFVRTAEITAPTAGQEVSGIVNFAATLTDDDTDPLQWAVRSGTCAAGVGTVAGNVDGKTDAFAWIDGEFSASVDMSLLTPGDYCFVFNPTEDNGESDIRLTQNFTLIAPVVDPVDPTTKDECKVDGWMNFGFANQGQCVRFVETGKDSR